MTTNGERIAIVGCSGAGKSQLATTLGARLGLPVVHLDRLFWKPGWVESTQEEFLAAQDRALPAAGRWIADGNYGGTLELRLGRADTVIFLDLPTRVCLWRVVTRSWRTMGQTRPDLPDGCAERMFERAYLDFLGYVVSFRRRRRPGLLSRLRSLDGRVRLVVLSSNAEVARLIAG
jgi:adenylate kinase family enzyme